MGMITRVQSIYRASFSSYQEKGKNNRRSDRKKNNKGKGTEGFPLSPPEEKEPGKREWAA